MYSENLITFFCLSIHNTQTHVHVSAETDESHRQSYSSETPGISKTNSQPNKTPKKISLRNSQNPQTMRPTTKPIHPHQDTYIHPYTTDKKMTIIIMKSFVFSNTTPLLEQ